MLADAAEIDTAGAMARLIAFQQDDLPAASRQMQGGRTADDPAAHHQHIGVDVGAAAHPAVPLAADVFFFMLVPGPGSLPPARRRAGFFPRRRPAPASPVVGHGSDRRYRR